MPKLNSEYTIPDLSGEIKHIKQYLETMLGFDIICQCDIQIKHDKIDLNINAEDRFQSKRSYRDKIGEVRIWETGSDLSELLAEAWSQLLKAMKRDERELRFGLAQLGDSIEGDEFKTEVGKMMAERIKAIRDELSGNLLTWQQSQEPEEPSDA